MSVIAAGTPAPQFKLARNDGSSLAEHDLEGQGSVLVSYPFAFARGSIGRIHQRGRV